SVEISGPYGLEQNERNAPAAASGHPGTPTPSRERIFVCEPETPEGTSARDASCAQEILATVARRAYRRAVTDADIEPLLAFYREGVSAGGFDAGIHLALKRLLVSPEFLFRVERDPEGLPPGAVYEVGPFELASRLSFFLWSSIPDDELLAAAGDGRLLETAELERQVRRMLADPRADAFIENFAGQWLFLRNLAAI